MVVIRFANLLVLIFRKNDPKSDIFDMDDLFFFMNFLFLEHFHLFQRKKLPKKLSLETFRFFSLYMMIYQDMFLKNDLELEIFNRKGPIFFSPKVFSRPYRLIGRKKSKKTLSRKVVGTPWIYPLEKMLEDLTFDFLLYKFQVQSIKPPDETLSRVETRRGSYIISLTLVNGILNSPGRFQKF